MKKPTNERAALSRACGSAWQCLQVLCVPNADLKWRIHNGFSELMLIDDKNLPEHIQVEYSNLWKSLMGAPKLKYKSETVPQANVRELSWKKRQQAAERIAFVCALIFEEWGAIR